VAEPAHVDASRRDVGRHEHAVLSALEAGERLGPLRLRSIAVNALDRDPMLAEVPGQAVGAVFGAGEDQRVLDFFAKEPHEQRRLERLWHRVDGLRDTRGRRRGTFHIDRDWIAQHVTRQLRNRGRHRRAEQQRLPLCWQVAENAPNVRQKTHVEHAVCLVEHQVLERGEPGIGGAEVIEQAAWRGDDHVHAASKGMFLRAHADAAVHGGRGERRVHGEIVEIGEDLRRQLARRREHQRARRAARPSHEPVQDRQQERGRFAASGHRGREEVAAGKRGRYGGGLNGGRLPETELLDAAHQGRVKLQRGEWHGCDNILVENPRNARRYRSGTHHVRLTW
jgi:hypothetical protein